MAPPLLGVVEPSRSHLVGPGQCLRRPDERRRTDCSPKLTRPNAPWPLYGTRWSVFRWTSWPNWFGPRNGPHGRDTRWNKTSHQVWQQHRPHRGSSGAGVRGRRPGQLDMRHRLGGQTGRPLAAWSIPDAVRAHSIQKAQPVDDTTHIKIFNDEGKIEILKIDILTEL